MTRQQAPTRYDLVRALLCIIVGAVSTWIPTVIAGLAIGYFAVDKNLTVVICFGVFTIYCEQAMTKLTKMVSQERYMVNIAYFLGFAVAFILASAYTVRNLCEMVIGDSPNMTNGISIVFGIVAAFYVTAVFQDLLNHEVNE